MKNRSIGLFLLRREIAVGQVPGDDAGVVCAWYHALGRRPAQGNRTQHATLGRVTVSGLAADQ